MSLTKPVLSDDDLQNSRGQSARQVWNMWSKDPIKSAVLRAVLPVILSCRVGISLVDTLISGDMGSALSQTVRFLHSLSLEVEEVYY
jgi:hypothetical protein